MGDALPDLGKLSKDRDTTPQPFLLPRTPKSSYPSLSEVYLRAPAFSPLLRLDAALGGCVLRVGGAAAAWAAGINNTLLLSCPRCG